MSKTLPPASLLSALLSTVLIVPLVAQDTQKPAPLPKSKAAVAAPATQGKDAVPPIALARITGSFADLPEVGADLAGLLLGGAQKPKSFFGLIEQLDELTADPTTKRVLFDLSDGFGLNGAQVAEVERALGKMRRSGKKLYAYLENAGPVQMQWAALCDHVILADLGGVEIPSLSLSVMFMKDAMDLLGVQMDVVRCGDFKGAVEPYVLSQMSTHLRQHYLDMLGRMNADVVRRIAGGRRIAGAEVRRLQEQRLLSAQQALDAGLVDELVPWIGAKSAFGKVVGATDLQFKDALSKRDKRKTLNFFTLMTQLLNPQKADSKVDKGLVVLHLSGAIVDGTKRAPGSIVSGPTVSEIRSLRDNENVKGVVVRVNSPGGSATASEAILLALKELAKAKPVVFSMGRVAASGGYYVTCVGRPILAEAGTITGSIGVFGMRPTLGALMRRVGLHEEIVGLDEGAEFMALTKTWSSGQRAVVQGFINTVYDRFTGHVAASRGLAIADVLKLAGGRVWSGEQAVDHKLVDRIGGLEHALTMVAKEAGIGDDYEVTHLPKPADMFAALMRDMMDVKALLPDATLRLAAKRLGGLEPALRILYDALTAERPTQAWVMMPEMIRLR
jgi:protease-4